MMRKGLFKCCLLALFCIMSQTFIACSQDTSDLEKRIRQLEDAIAELEGDTSVDTSLEALQTKISELETTVGTLNTLIDALETDNSVNKTDIATLKTKVEALESVSALYGQRIDGLETASATYATDIADLQKELSDLTGEVVNAKFIERTVIKPEDVSMQADIVKTVYINVYRPDLTQKVKNIQIACTLGHDDYSFNYQLVTFKVELFRNDASLQKFDVSVTQAKSGEQTLDQSFNTKIPFDDNWDDVYTATWSEIVLYRFV